MYEKHFNLSAPPFQLTPDPRFLFESSVHGRAIAHLQYGLQQNEGFIVVTGEVGAGKTTIIGHLLDTLDRHKYIATTVVTTNIDGDDIIRLIASGFKLPHEGRDKATLLLDIENFLYDCVRRNKRCLIFVDEAQNLTIETLEELRMLSNIHVNGIAPVQLFLLGQPQFRRTLAKDDLLQLRQRVIASYHLGPLDAEDTKEYILHRLTRVGWQNNPSFDEEAFEKVFDYTGGVPRRINTLCSRILLFCYLEEQDHISAETVELVAEDLEREFDQVLDHGDKSAPEKVEASPEPTPTEAQKPPQVAEERPETPAPQPQPQPQAQPQQPPQVQPQAAPITHINIGFAPQQAPQMITDNILQEVSWENVPASENWKQEVFDLIESTPVETLAELGRAMGAPEQAPEQLNDPLEQGRSNNKIFKRLLLLILEEYLKGRPEANQN